jgi:ankyrin repeat protein
MKNIPVETLNKNLADAVTMGHAEVCKSLLEQGADANTVILLPVPPLSDLPRTLENGLFKYAGDPKNTVLIEAVQNNRMDIVRLLIESQANLNIANLNGATALMKAAKNGNIDMLQLLLEKGADVHQKAAPIAATVENGVQRYRVPTEFYPMQRYEYVRVSGNLSEDSNILGMNALDIALKFEHHRVGDLLIRAGATRGIEPSSSASVGTPLLMQHTYNNIQDIESRMEMPSRKRRECVIS